VPSRVSGAEVDVRFGEILDSGGRARWYGRGDEFPGEEVDDLADVEVGDAKFLALFDGEGVAMAGFHGGVCWLLELWRIIWLE